MTVTSVVGTGGGGRGGRGGVPGGGRGGGTLYFGYSGRFMRPGVGIPPGGSHCWGPWPQTPVFIVDAYFSDLGGVPGNRQGVSRAFGLVVTLLAYPP